MRKYEIPRENPVYHFMEADKKKKPRLYLALDRFLTVYGFLLVFAYAVLLLGSSFPLQWRSIALFILFWIMLTYIAFPRVHSFFTTMYLPDYFLSRTKTGDGILGDPVNMGILGTEEDIHAAMQQAGWIKADPITLRSSLGIIFSTLKHRPYPEAPVSSLFLFDHKQDFAYQMEVDGSASRRHHVRFWKVPEGWHLPGGKRVEWLAAGTFDKGVGLSSATLQVTHKIDKYVDKERDYIIESLLFIDHDITVDVIEEFAIPYCDENGGGDSIETDGDMPIVDVTGAAERAENRNQTIKQREPLEIPIESEALNKELPPKSLLYIGAFTIFKLVISLVGFILILFINSSGDYLDGVSNQTVFLASLVSGLVTLLLYILTLKKFKWSRLIFLIIASISCTVETVTLFTHFPLGLFELIHGGISVAIVLILSSPEIRRWVYTIERRGQ